MKAMYRPLLIFCLAAMAGAGLLPLRLAAAYMGPASFCESLPDRADKNSVIFLGIVKQVITPVTTLSPSGTFQENRQRQGDPPLRIEPTYPTAQFQVIEGFVGVDSEDFEVRMTSDHFVDGIPQHVPPFAAGELWLVEAVREPRDQQWITSYGQRTKPVSEAEDDLRVLRAWSAGQHLPAKVTGEVFRPSEKRGVSGIEIHLLGDGRALLSITDSLGQFSFENLPDGVYEATATLPPGAQRPGPLRVDLTRTHAWCSRVVFLTK
jgi:hypothetical protein